MPASPQIVCGVEDVAFTIRSSMNTNFLTPQVQSFLSSYWIQVLIVLLFIGLRVLYIIEGLYAAFHTCYYV